MKLACTDAGFAFAALVTFLVSATPAAAEPACTPESISVGTSPGVCVLRNDGQVACFATDELTNSLPRSDRRPGAFTQIATASNRACGVRTDGTVDCWADIYERPAPAGLFRQIVLADTFECGVRPDGMAWCSHEFEKPTPTESRFLEIVIAFSGICGRRVDHTIECWAGDVAAPSGTFSQIDGEGPAICGVHDDGTLECWGSEPPENPPSGTFRKVAYSWALGPVALRDDGQLVSWGSFPVERLPADEFVDVDIDKWVCGIRTDRSVACSSDFGSMPLAGQFLDISVNGDFTLFPVTCGIDRDHSIRCTGRWYDRPVEAPAGRFRQVAVGGAHACAIRDDGTLSCWGDNRKGQSDAPQGIFRDVSAGIVMSCAIDDDAHAACWGEGVDVYGVPDGEFVEIEVGGSHACALREDGTATCREYYFGTPEYEAPPGRFLRLSAAPGNGLGGARSNTCGIRPDLTVECWGDNANGAGDAPDGQFLDVAAGDDFSCGLRVDGTIDCWGYISSSPPWALEIPTGTFVQVAVGPSQLCGRTEDGDVECRGYEHAMSFCPTPQCGNAVVDPDEDCDDGESTVVPGHRCSPGCERTLCGQPVSRERPQPCAGDALFTLEAAIGAEACDPEVCDADGSEAVTTIDALLVLRSAVGLGATLHCPE